jgi:hypothetical protein
VPTLQHLQPPFFKPIFSHVKGPIGLQETAAISGQQQVQPKVKIFLTLPDSKPGSVVKIPNVSHIQVIITFSYISLSRYICISILFVLDLNLSYYSFIFILFFKYTPSYLSMLLYLNHSVPL